MMATKQRDWSWWSEVKLDILRDYLKAFALASQTTSERVYLDLFAGSYHNKRRDNVGTFAGSAQIAFNIDPIFTRVALFERPSEARLLESEIQEAMINRDRWWKIYDGDCNVTIAKALNDISTYQWAPTFSFLDPCGLQVKWETVTSLSQWKRKGKPKIEQLILFPEPALLRVIGAEVSKGKRSAQLIDEIFGTNDWLRFYHLRRIGYLDANEMRKNLIHLYKQRLREVLGYQYTHSLGIGNNNMPIYTLIFATDHRAGNDIMKHINSSYSGNIIPDRQARANINRRERQGQSTLDGMGESETGFLQTTDEYSNFGVAPPLPFEDINRLYDEILSDASPSTPFSWSDDSFDFPDSG